MIIAKITPRYITHAHIHSSFNLLSVSLSLSSQIAGITGQSLGISPNGGGAPRAGARRWQRRWFDVDLVGRLVAAGAAGLESPAPSPWQLLVPAQQPHRLRRLRRGQTARPLGAQSSRPQEDAAGIRPSA